MANIITENIIPFYKKHISLNIHNINNALTKKENLRAKEKSKHPFNHRNKLTKINEIVLIFYVIILFDQSLISIILTWKVCFPINVIG